MTNFEAFRWVISSSINLLFLKSDDKWLISIRKFYHILFLKFSKLSKHIHHFNAVLTLFWFLSVWNWFFTCDVQVSVQITKPKNEEKRILWFSNTKGCSGWNKLLQNDFVSKSAKIFPHKNRSIVNKNGHFYFFLFFFFF